MWPDQLSNPVSVALHAAENVKKQKKVIPRYHFFLLCHIFCSNSTTITTPIMTIEVRLIILIKMMIIIIT